MNIKPFYYSGPSPVYNCPFIIEHWKEITQDVVPYILDGYYISTYGRVYSARSNKFLSINKSVRGYNQVLLFGTHGKTICSRIDRLIMKTFYPITNMDKMQVNHRNCDNGFDMITNLEWTTPKENTDYAVMNGYCDYKRDRSLCKELSIVELEEIGQLLKSRSMSQINIANKYNVSIDTIESISTGKIKKYLWVYDKYDLGSIKGTKPHKGIYSIDQIHLLCKYFQDNLKNLNSYPTKRAFYQECINFIDDFSIIDYNKIAFLDRLRARSIYKDIVSLYDF